MLMPGSRIRKLLTESSKHSDVDGFCSYFEPSFLKAWKRRSGRGDHVRVAEGSRGNRESNGKEDLRNVCPVGEIAQRKNYLLCKHRDLSVDS